MKNKLNWFDKLMLAVTFAEAGVSEPILKSSPEKEAGASRQDDKPETTTFTPRKRMGFQGHM